jgi:hypothetical protein
LPIRKNFVRQEEGRKEERKCAVLSAQGAEKAKGERRQETGDRRQEARKEVRSAQCAGRRKNKRRQEK